MAAFLAVDVLRAYAVPVFPCVTSDHGHESAWPRPAAEPRPVLTAHWLMAPDGRLTCRWQTDVSAPFGPPPH
jgi:hypothetical protein